MALNIPAVTMQNVIAYIRRQPARGDANQHQWRIGNTNTGQGAIEAWCLLFILFYAA
jgi:hypothetical protein